MISYRSGRFQNHLLKVDFCQNIGEQIFQVLILAHIFTVHTQQRFCRIYPFVRLKKNIRKEETTQLYFVSFSIEKLT